MSSDLLRIQQQFQRAVLRDAGAGDGIAGSDSDDRATRFRIYAFAYRVRMRDALAHNFPMLKVHLGESDFAAVADAYNDAHQSTYASVRAIGSQLGSWLAHHRADEPWLAEFAQLEWALGAAFDASDESTLSIDVLSSVQPGDWSSLQFRIAASVRRLSLATNAPTLYGNAAREEAPSPGRVERRSSEWLVWRESLRAHYRPMSTVEAVAFDTVARGYTFGTMCERLLEDADCAADDDAALQAAACLKRWLGDELLVTFSIADD
jgi:hypothetical protein